MQAKHLRHVQRWKALARLNDGLCQAPGHAGIAIQPTNGLHALATIAATNAPEQNAQAHRMAENGQITNDALAILMSG